MCGIAGFWNCRSSRPAERARLEAMVGSLVHRGPDEDGFYIDGDLAIGMRRLQVIDPLGGRQPMPNEDGSVHVVFNGEIYNHAELRRQLEAAGHRFRTRCDTEAIVHAWEEWGTGCVERLNGMFAIAVWDGRRRQLFLARDRLGIKPLHFRDGPGGVVFGSELKAVVADPDVPLEWDLEAVDEFLTWEYVPAPRTIVAGVEKLPAGCWILFAADGTGARPRPQRYWTMQPGTAPRDADQAAERLRELLQTAVRRRLMADVPLGAFLSGGIDSSIIVALMSRETPGRVRSFSLGFEDRSYDELDYARSVAQLHGTQHTEALVTPDILDMAGRIAGFYDEPFGDVSAFPTHLVSALARRHVTVALSGDGGDELFAGYDHYRAHRWADRIRLLTASRGWRAVDRLLDAVPPAPAKKGPINKVKRFAEGLRRPADLEHARWLAFWDVQERRALYTPAALERLAGRDCFGTYRALLAEAADHGFTGLRRQLFADVRGYLADDILAKVDRASMAVSLEVRVPFLDHEVVEFAMSLPDDWKLRGGETKWILRRAFADVLPPRVRQRGKEGFSMPMKHWLRGPLRPLAEQLLAPERVRARGWFDAAEVQRLLAGHMRGRHNHAHRLWCLMALELSLDTLQRTAHPAARPLRHLARG
jgi:asparagine synthase (glutamine-hydrolysing)